MLTLDVSNTKFSYNIRRLTHSFTLLAHISEWFDFEDNLKEKELVLETKHRQVTDHNFSIKGHGNICHALKILLFISCLFSPHLVK